MIRRPQSFTLFPFTTLFRYADIQDQRVLELAHILDRLDDPANLVVGVSEVGAEDVGLLDEELLLLEAQLVPRSEEHTSELQSHSDLVCRLLLEKKKKSTTQPLRVIRFCYLGFIWLISLAP